MTTFTPTNDTSSLTGVLISFAEITCPLPEVPVNIHGNPTSTVGTPVGGFSVTVSNDGVNFSLVPTTVIVHDSKCIQCNTVTGMCRLKVKYEYINMDILTS